MARVLLIEDGPGDVELVRLAADEAPEPIDLQVVPDGEAALGALRAQPWPDLVLLDLNLPGSSGLEVLRRIRAFGEAGRWLVVVVMSTSSDPDEVRAAYAAGANAYVVKPLALEPFADRMRVLWRFWLATARRP